MKAAVRIAGLAAALVVLAGCDREEPLPTTAPPQLATVAVGTGADAGRGWDGVVEAVRQAALAAQTSGRIASVEADIGDRVDAGQVLLRITAVEQRAATGSARAQLRSADAAAAEAEANYRRFAALAPSQYVSRAQIDQARAARDVAIAAREAARAQLAQIGQQVDYTVVRAPYDGVVSAREVEPGETVVPGQPLMTVHAPGALRIEVDVPQSVADAIRRKPEATVLLDDGRRATVAGVVVYPGADPATHSVTVRVALPPFDPPPAPGTSARVVFPVSGGDTVPRIPATALVQRGEVSAVYVLDERALRLRQLRLGRRLGDEVEVLSGLKPGERVAADPVAAGQAMAAQRDAGGAGRE